jgi:hypothetical protein
VLSYLEHLGVTIGNAEIVLKEAVNDLLAVAVALDQLLHLSEETRQNEQREEERTRSKGEADRHRS